MYITQTHTKKKRTYLCDSSDLYLNVSTFQSVRISLYFKHQDTVLFWTFRPFNQAFPNSVCWKCTPSIFFTPHC